MFEKVVVSSVNHGKAVVFSYRHITEIKSDGEYIHISDGIYTWNFKIDTIVSIVIV